MIPRLEAGGWRRRGAFLSHGEIKAAVAASKEPKKGREVLHMTQVISASN